MLLNFILILQATNINTTFANYLSIVLTSKWVSLILFSLGIACLVITLFKGGFGLSGLIGVFAMVLYWVGGFFSGNAEWWTLPLFFVGLVLVFLELFIPGGIVGIFGFFLMILSVIFAAPTKLQGLVDMGIAVIVTIIILPILLKKFERPKALKRLILEDTVGIHDNIKHKIHDNNNLIGKTGKVVSTLRPTGIIIIDGESYDVLSDGTYIESGSIVKVTQIKGDNIIVSQVSNVTDGL